MLADKFQANLVKNIDDREDGLKKAALLIQSAMKEELDTAGTPDSPSRPGEPPRRQTGRLMESVDVDLAKGQATVSSGVPYGSYLENGTSKMAARPWFRRAIEQTRAACRNLVFGI